MKVLLMLVGLVAFAVGLLWIGQGLNIVKWPASSFMISETQWAYYGGGLAVLGVIIIWFSRR